MSYSIFSPAILELSLVDECHHKKENAFHIPHVHFDSCQSDAQSVDSRCDHAVSVHRERHIHVHPDVRKQVIAVAEGDRLSGIRHDPE